MRRSATRNVVRMRELAVGLHPRKGRIARGAIVLAGVSRRSTLAAGMKAAGHSNHAGISGTAIVGARPDAVFRQPDRLRDRASDSRQHHRHDALAKRRRRRQALARPADRGARPRPPDVACNISRWIGGILLHGDFGKSLWQNTPVRELLAARLPVTFELGLMALIVALTVAHPDRRLFGDPPGHRRRLYRRARSRS